VQGANWTIYTVVREQRTANRAGSFILRYRHRILLETRTLLDLISNGSRKIPRDESNPVREPSRKE
jgi:hypothetical protein